VSFVIILSLTPGAFKNTEFKPQHQKKKINPWNYQWSLRSKENRILSVYVLSVLFIYTPFMGKILCSLLHLHKTLFPQVIDVASVRI
jgi:hypothetical protein